MKESVIENRLRRGVNHLDGMCLKWQMGWPGAPDRVVIWPGGVVHFIETKAPGADLRPLQQKRREQLEKLGCSVFRIRTQEEVDEYLRCYGK